jgi:hypothetical protein
VGIGIYIFWIQGGRLTPDSRPMEIKKSYLFSARFIAFLQKNQLNFLFIRPALFRVGRLLEAIEMKATNKQTDKQQMKRTVVMILFFFLLFIIIYYLDSNL